MAHQIKVPTVDNRLELGLHGYFTGKSHTHALLIRRRAEMRYPTSIIRSLGTKRSIRVLGYVLAKTEEAFLAEEENRLRSDAPQLCRASGNDTM